MLTPEASQIVPDFTISVNSGPCNYFFAFSPMLASLPSLSCTLDTSKAQDRMGCHELDRERK